MTSEVLVAVDGSLRELVTKVLSDLARPWFVTRVVFVSTGGVGLTRSRGYNLLASLARGEVIVLYEGDFTTYREKDCPWLHKMVRPSVPGRAWLWWGSTKATWRCTRPQGRSF